MTQQTINVGTAANDRTGDTLRLAFQKINANFTELYSGAANESQLTNGSYTLTISSAGILTLSSGITGLLRSDSGVISTAVAGQDYITPFSSPTLRGLSISAGTLSIDNSTLRFQGNISSAAWTTTGIRHVAVPATLTDTTSTGTVASAYTNTFGGNTIAATNTGVTYTNYSTAYFNDPTAGTNVTITNPYSLMTAGNVKIGTTNPFIFNATTGGVLFPTLTTAMRDDTTRTVQTLMFSDASNEVVISPGIPATNVDGKTITIQGAVTTGTASGGGINIWCGNGATKGGDINLFSGKSSAGISGSITIGAGPGYTAGGQIVIAGGTATGGIGAGGNVIIRGGPGASAGLYGDVRIATGTNPGGPIWYFKDTGRVIFPALGLQSLPATSKGASGDTAGMFAIDATYFYYCIASYTNGTPDIWKRTPHAAGTW